MLRRLKTPRIFRFFLLAVCAVFLIVVHPEAHSQDASSLGETAGNNVLANYGSKEGITANVSNPLTSSNTPMTTIDGTTSFSGQLACPNSQSFMEVLIQPGVTGDIVTFIVSQDTNFDGALDYSFTVPFPVSGLCANGVIGCNAGAWTNCQSYQWTSDATGRAILKKVALTSLGGCFCINNSCGTNLVFDNTPTIMNVIGGGVTGAIQKYDARYAISNVRIDGMLATYYGQNSGACTASSTPAAHVENYYYNPGSMQSDAAAQAASDAATPSSTYRVLETSGAANNEQVKTCQVARGDSIQWNASDNCYVEYNISDQCAALESSSNCQLYEETVDGVVTVENYFATGLEPISSCQYLTNTLSASCEYTCPLGVSYPCTGAGLPTCTNGAAVADCTVINPVASAGGSWSKGMIMSGSGSRLSFITATCPFGSGYMCEENTSTGKMTCSLSAGGYSVTAACTEAVTGYIQFTPGIEVWGSVNTTWVSDNWRYFQVYSSGAGAGYDSSLTVTDQYGTIVLGTLYFKGVNVSSSGTCAPNGSVSASASSWNLAACWLSYHGTGYGSGTIDFSPNQCPLSGASSCIGNPSYCSKSCAVNDCEPWWRKTRTYTCTGGGYDFSRIRKRVSTINTSAADNGSAMSYNDYLLSGTAWVSTSSSYATNNVYRPDVGSCQRACKTEANVDNTATTVTTTKSDVTLDSMTPVFYYHSCTSVGCPAGPGETIVIDCQCIDEFAEAAVIMQTLRKGAQDMICSDGTPEPL